MSKRTQKTDEIEVAEPNAWADVEDLINPGFDARRQRFRRIDGFETEIDAALFGQCSAVARLALELARLKVQQGEVKVSPSDSLREAADMILASAEFIAVNPNKDLERAREDFFKVIENAYSMNKIRGNKAKGIKVRMKDGTLFYLPPYKGESDRGFEDFVTSHFHRLITLELERQSGPQDQKYTLRSELEKRLASGDNGLRDAVDFMRGTDYGIRASLLKQAAQEKGKDDAPAWASAVVDRWANLAAREASEEHIMDWRNNGISFVELRSLAESKGLGNYNKGNGKRRKSGGVEGTTNGEPKKVKKQAGGRKKQA